MSFEFGGHQMGKKCFIFIIQLFTSMSALATGPVVPNCAEMLGKLTPYQKDLGSTTQSAQTLEFIRRISFLRTKKVLDENDLRRITESSRPVQPLKDLSGRISELTPHKLAFEKLLADLSKLNWAKIQDSARDLLDTLETNQTKESAWREATRKILSPLISHKDFLKKGVWLDLKTVKIMRAETGERYAYIHSGSENTRAKPLFMDLQTRAIHPLNFVFQRAPILLKGPEGNPLLLGFIDLEKKAGAVALVLYDPITEMMRRKIPIGDLLSVDLIRHWRVFGLKNLALPNGHQGALIEWREWANEFQSATLDLETWEFKPTAHSGSSWARQFHASHDGKSAYFYGIDNQKDENKVIIRNLFDESVQYEVQLNDPRLPPKEASFFSKLFSKSKAKERLETKLTLHQTKSGDLYLAAVRTRQDYPGDAANEYYGGDQIEIFNLTDNKRHKYENHPWIRFKEDNFIETPNGGLFFIPSPSKDRADEMLTRINVRTGEVLAERVTMHANPRFAPLYVQINDRSYMLNVEAGDGRKTEGIILTDIETGQTQKYDTSKMQIDEIQAAYATDYGNVEVIFGSHNGNSLPLRDQSLSILQLFGPVPEKK